MTEKKTVTNTAGLRGVNAGRTAICSCGVEGMGLNYRGYDIAELAAHTCFEEIAYLLIRGQLPTAAQLSEYRRKLRAAEPLPRALTEVLERIPAGTHPMDVMRTGCSMLGALEPENGFAQQQDIADRLLAAFPGIIAYWYHFAHHGRRIDTTTDEETLAGHLLHLLVGRRPAPLHRDAMDVSLILYAEHEFNASTFAVRVCAATLSDFYSATIQELERCRPIFEEMPGWSEDIRGVRRLADFPQATRNYLKRLEELAGVPIQIISVGPDRDETIMVQNPFD